MGSYYMDLFDIQTTLTLAAILTATAVVVFFDYLRRQRRKPQRVHVSKSATPRQQIRIFEPEPVTYAPPRPRRLAAEPAILERPLEKAIEKQAEKAIETLVAFATPSRPPVEPRMERETLTVQVTPPSPPASSDGGSNQLSTIILPPFTIDAALWERLISSQPKRNLIASADFEPLRDVEPAPVTRTARTIDATYRMIRDDAPDAASTHLPIGMIQPALLEKWLESEQRFTGLVVSIGVNEGDSSMWHSRGLMQSLATYIAGLLKARDYACRTSYDEFLIVCPGEQGPQSQRRLNHISERLWDYQLRGMGASSILFSWGGVQVQDQPLAEAVASAADRMRETKRTSQMKSAPAHRPAV